MRRKSEGTRTELPNVLIRYLYIGVTGLLLTAGLTGCAVVPAEEEEALPKEALVDIMYATDRNVTGDYEVNTFYGEERGDMNYGIAQVAIRIDKSVSPFADYSIWNLRFKGSTRKQAELIRISPLNKKSFLNSLSNRIQKSEDKSALVYTHGYSRNFEHA